MRPTIEVLAERMAGAGVALEVEHLTVFARLARQQFVPVGSRLAIEGEPADSLYVICDGELAVTLSSGADVARLGLGAIAGEVSLLDGGPATATLTAATDVTVLALDREGLQRMRDEEPKTATALLQALCETIAKRVRESSDMFEVLATDGAPIMKQTPRSFLDALKSLFGLKVVA